ncbi:MAG: flavin reductase [Mesorhizobium sp.]|uniref:flavin reductase family protein n=1 Tax=Mesorhizobium sp. TaxID=1871066 RepID=UPI000FE5532D|nr:flavin reductase family protein [Mesorhizobium sp.]RWI50501.1 MAG: flavin reductase [Mesorhizobium sp.]
MQVDASTMTFDSRAFRNALGCFPTGVAIVTAKTGNEPPVGMTINSFSSVSLDPPLVLWSLRRNAFSRDGYLKAGRFVINVLREDQKHLAMRFAQPESKYFRDEEIEHSEDGMLRLSGCAATFDCTTAEVVDAGDHLILIGEVQRFIATDLQPLVFCRGAFAALGATKIIKS